jgi:hypothetical protein
MCHVQGGRYEQAIECYTRSLEALPRDDHPEAAKIYSNRASLSSGSLSATASPPGWWVPQAEQQRPSSAASAMCERIVI